MFLPDNDAKDDLKELFLYFQNWINQKESLLNLRKEELDERENKLKLLEAKLTGNGS